MERKQFQDEYDDQKIIEAFRKGEIIDTNSEESTKSLKKLLNVSTVATPEEKEEVEKSYESERGWWEDIPPYKTSEDIENAVASGELIKIENDENLQLIMRLANPELKEYPPYLPEKTARLLKTIGQKWRERMQAENLPKDIKLAVTSLTRSQEYQKKLVENGALAVEKSSHLLGKSFDIDGCGYYQAGKPINPRQTKNYENNYNPKVHQILKLILEKMQAENLLHFILEFPGKSSQCFHITVSPKYVSGIKNDE